MDLSYHIVALRVFFHCKGREENSDAFCSLFSVKYYSNFTSFSGFYFLSIFFGSFSPVIGFFFTKGIAHFLKYCIDNLF